MKTTSEIHDLIQTCYLYPNEDSMRRVLNILDHLNNRISKLEGEVERVKDSPIAILTAEHNARIERSSKRAAA